MLYNGSSLLLNHSQVRNLLTLIMQLYIIIIFIHIIYLYVFHFKICEPYYNIYML